MAKVTAVIAFDTGAMDSGSTKLGVTPGGGGKSDVRLES